MATQKQSMMAILGLLAVAGYRNRDKIGDLLAQAKDSLPAGAGADKDGNGDLASELGGLLGGTAAGGTLAGGLDEIINRFKKNGQGAAADSWVGAGENQALPASSMEQAIGDDLLAELSAKTGMSKQDIVSRLSADLPGAVDDFTPQGRLPTEQEAAAFR